MTPRGGGGHGEWHGPHESPKSMTIPLQILAVGAILAGFVGIPAALGGGNAIEHFLEPSFVARAVVEHATAQRRRGSSPERGAQRPSRRVEPTPKLPASMP